MAPALSKVARPALNAAALLRVIGQTTTPVRYAGHGPRTMRPRHTNLPWQRAKDIMHFYLVGLCIIPASVFYLTVNVVYGPCELQDHPAEGELSPRYWQYERTPIRQWATRLICRSDVEDLERNAAMFKFEQLKLLHRDVQKRVRHLMGQRQDYQGYHYQPAVEKWIESAKYLYDYQRHRENMFSHFVEQ